MQSTPGQKHPNYVGLNLVGYGLAKFEGGLLQALGFNTKADLYRDLIARQLAKTRGTIKNRQDLFNPLVRGGKIGWWQNGNRYIHRKMHLDALFGSLDAHAYALMLTQYLDAEFPGEGKKSLLLPPLLKSRFQQLQETGAEGEFYFLQNYRQIGAFAEAEIEDGRLMGDGYDFQLSLGSQFCLAEVKGLRTDSGSIRLTANEFNKAEEYRASFCLVVISGLDSRPLMAPIFDPLSHLHLDRKTIVAAQVYYQSTTLEWKALVA
jgi:hypothetical protein